MPDNDHSSTTGSGAPSSPVGRAFRLLQIVVAAEGPLGVRELARRSGLPRSTVSRLVGVLAELGMVERTVGGAVMPGTALSTLQPDAATPLLRDQLAPLLAELAARFDEHAALAVDDGEQMRYLDQISADNIVTVPDVAGDRQPYHLVGGGLLYMARWPAERLDRYLGGPLTTATVRSVDDPDEIRRRLAQATVDGFVWTEGELELDVNGLAVPVVHGGELTAAVSLYGPSYRFSPQRCGDWPAQLTTLVAERADALLSS